MPKKEKDLIEKLALKGNKLTKREKLMPIMVVSVIVITLVLFLRPLTNTISETKKSLAENKIILEELVKQRKTLTNIQNSELGQKLDVQLQNAESYLPSRRPALEVLLNLTALARMDEVSFTGVTLNPGNVKEEEEAGKTQEKAQTEAAINTINTVNNYELSVSVSGEKNKLFKFITDLKELSPLMKIEEISTSYKEDETGKLKNLYIDSNMKLLVHYQELPEKFDYEKIKFEYITEDELALMDTMSNYLFTNSRFKTIDSGIYGVVVGVTNPFSGGQ